MKSGVASSKKRLLASSDFMMAEEAIAVLD
jgi:hypothetical protein